jgi:hypothetical protein
VLVDVLLSVARTRNIPILLSIHQPKHETYAKLSSLLLLHHGHCLYQGPPLGEEVDKFLAKRGMGGGGGREGGSVADLMIEALFVGKRRGKEGGKGMEVAVVREEEEEEDDDEDEEEEGKKEGKETRFSSSSSLPRLPPTPLSPSSSASPTAAPIAAPLTPPSDGDWLVVNKQVFPPSSASSSGPSSLPASPSSTSYWVQVAVLSQRMLRDHLRRPWLIAAHVLANVYLGGK